MNTRIIDFLSSDQILLVKLKNVSFQNTDLTLYRLQFWTFSNVILHLEQGNVYSIKIWRHWFLLLHPPWSGVQCLFNRHLAFCMSCFLQLMWVIQWYPNESFLIMSIDAILVVDLLGIWELWTFWKFYIFIGLLAY